MIIDLPRFIEAERKYWDELQSVLRGIETDPLRRMPLEEIQRLYYLYERCSADLAQLDTFSTDPGLRVFLVSLVSRAYSEIHETRAPVKIRWKEALLAFPRAFRRHMQAFQLSALVTLLGCLFGWFALVHDARSKSVLMPFTGLMETPAQRVAREEAVRSDQMKDVKATFSAQLMANNIRVTLTAMAAGITWGAGTLVILFYNGVGLGAVVADYTTGGQGLFLAGWLLPHGSVEIPAILIGGQAGFIIAGALIGWGEQTPRRLRFRAVTSDLLAIACGIAGMLVWAGIMEAFVSQYHRPVIPYELKIGLGLCELIALAAFLGLAGRK